jgi:plastocyanin
MTRRSTVLSSIVSAMIIAHVGSLHGASGSIKGTVKATGLASNAEAVIYIQQVSGAAPAPKSVDMDQKQFQFIPHVLPIVAGNTVKFLNSDPTPHNVFSPDYEKYNLGTWPQGQTKEHAFTKCAKPPCVYTQLCRVHPEMEGFVVVLQNPYFAVTDKTGQFEIQNVPPGSYTLAVWHAKLKAQPKPVTVEDAKSVTVDFVLGR